MTHMTKFLLASVICTATLLAASNVAYAEVGNRTETTYLNGGIGQEESAEMRAKAGDFNLRLYLSEGNRTSITNAKITITDKTSHVRIDIADGGPMLFLRLENGRYKINAQYNGINIIRNIVISNRHGTNVYLNWKNTETAVEATVENEQPQAF